LDDKIINLEMALSYYERIILKKKIQGSDETYYIFLDEIQLLANWQEVLMPYLDETYPIKFILASSSENFFNKKIISIPEECYSEFRIYPLSFLEYLNVKKLPVKNSITNFDNILDFNKTIENRIDFIDQYQDLDLNLRKYLIQGGFYRYLKETNPLKKTQRIVSEIIDLVIYKDINLLYNLPNPAILEDILLYLSRNNAALFEFDKAVTLFGGIQSHTMEKYLHYLEASFLIHTITNYNSDISKLQVSNKKVYFSDIGIRNALLGNYSLDLRDVNSLVDNAVFLHLLRIKSEYNFDLYYWRKGNFYCDLIIELADKKIPVIINYKQKQEKNIERNLIRFLDQEKGDKGIMVTKEDFDIVSYNDYQILKIPASVFLLDASL
jgi:predicted AAA+ superfamily ATPase